MIARPRGRYADESHPFRDYAASGRRRGNVDVEPEAEEIEDVNLNDTEEIFLKALIESPKHEIYKEEPEHQHVIRPLSINNLDTVKKLSEYRGNNIRSIEHAELAILFSKPHFRALIDAHDKIGAIWISRLLESSCADTIIDNTVFEDDNGEMPAQDTVKIVGIRKSAEQPLGLTVVKDEHGQLVVARVLAGGAVSKQGLLGPGDVVLEVNNVEVRSPDQLISECAKGGEHITLKVGPNNHLSPANGVIKNLKTYMRALYDYNPEDDTLLPCQQIGLPFNRGDILQVTDRKDPNWWQACKVDNPDFVGLIPSPELEERRKAYVPPEADFVHKVGICGTWVSKKKKKIIYESKNSSAFDRADLMLYEEVARMPPFNRKTLVLVGCRGVGKRTLKNRLINSDPDKFAAIVPHTSRPPRPLEENGSSYWFIEREEMEKDVRNCKFLEYGEHNGHLYGTHFDSIRSVIQQGKMCILDCSPASLKLLHNSREFLPYVIFLAAPGIEQLKNLNYSSNRNLQFDRQSSIRFSSRRARTLESLASLYEEEDLKSTLEESACLQRTYEKYIDLVIVNQDFDVTFRKVVDALENLSTAHQWVPVNWTY